MWLFYVYPLPRRTRPLPSRLRFFFVISPVYAAKSPPPSFYNYSTFAFVEGTERERKKGEALIINLPVVLLHQLLGLDFDASKMLSQKSLFCLSKETKPGCRDFHGFLSAHHFSLSNNISSPVEVGYF